MCLVAFFFSNLWGDLSSLFRPIYHSKAQPGDTQYACGRACLSGAAALVQVLVTFLYTSTFLTCLFVCCRKDTVWLLVLPKRFQKSRVSSLQQCKHFSDGRKKKKEKKVTAEAAQNISCGRLSLTL